eukprot:366058-Chlamydomonas_euryale.AAC.11
MRGPAHQGLRQARSGTKSQYVTLLFNPAVDVQSMLTVYKPATADTAAATTPTLDSCRAAAAFKPSVRDGSYGQ